MHLEHISNEDKYKNQKPGDRLKYVYPFKGQKTRLIINGFNK